MTDPRFYAPIVKTDDDQRMVYGYASTESLDSQGEVVKLSAMKAAVDDYMRFANVREMHQASAVGKTKSMTIDGKGAYISVKVADDNAWKKVKEGIYNGFSIGGHVNKQIGNTITGLSLSEISLVDRPANPDATFDVWKRDVPTDEKKKTKNMDKGSGDAMTLVQHIRNLESMRDNEANEGDETTSNHLNSALEHLRNAASSEVLENDNDTKENELMYLADQAKDVLKVVDEKINAGKMPTETEIDAMLKAQEISVNDKTRSVLKFELAGLIVKAVEKNMQKVQNLDYLKKQANMILDEADVKGADTVKDRSDFKKILSMVTEAEELMKTQNDTGNLYELSDSQDTVAVETTNARRANANNRGNAQGDWLSTRGDGDRDANEYDLKDETGLPQAENSNMATDGNPAQSLALDTLRNVVEMLNRKGLAGALTPDELDALENGVKAGSERTSINQTSIPQSGNAITAAAQIKNLKKVEANLMEKINKLTETVEKLARTPMPIKVKTSYQTIDKTAESTDGNAEYQKAITRASEINTLMKADPYNVPAPLQKEAAELSAHIMKLSREGYGKSGS